MSTAVAAAIILAVAATACTERRSPETTPMPGTPAELFSRYCAACHGPGGNGSGSRSGPALTRSTFTYGRTFDAVRESVKNGRGNRMPAFAKILSDDQINALATYVLSLRQ